jgi:hypothetical protein
VNKSNEELNILVEKGGWQGTKATGFVTADKGPFLCGNCNYFKQDFCGEEHVMEDPELQAKKLKNGRIPVTRGDCCNYFEKRD